MNMGKRLTEEAREDLRRYAYQRRWGGATARDVEEFRLELEADPANWREDEEEIEARLRELPRECRGRHTRTSLSSAAGGNAQRARRLIDGLIRRGEVG